MKRMRGAAFVAVALGLSSIGCATADKPGHCGGGACDLGVGTGGNGDADMADQALPTPDLATGKLGFGDSCGDNKQCKSGICVQTNTGGVCTDLCPDNSCPPGYGCIGVTGQIDPGIVTYVCVPNSTELCTPCVTNGECSVGGHDWCLPTPVGGHFCGRDCSKLGCPGGFSCQDVSLGDMGSGKQCVPTSGSCDCDAAKAGMTVPCSITTPTGTCQGTRTCNGASGWSTTCAPPSATDSPDDGYADDNCDGIDGDVTKGIFVAKAAATAVDDATCGTMAKPCKSIDWGISQAASAALRFVYVQAAVYNEEVVLFNGVDIVGGYDVKWQRAARGTAGHDVVITGGYDSTEGQFVSVLAHNIAATTTMRDLDIYGPNANDGLHAGFSSYAVHAYKSKLTLHRVGVFGGNGGDGRSGNSGTSAPNLTATAGMDGYVAPPSPPGPGNADEHSTACDNSGRGRGGDAGGNSCADDDDPTGGPGGGGGTMDTSCSCPLGVCYCSNCNATAGIGGSAAATAPGGYGYAGPGGLAGNDGSTSYSTGGGAGGGGRVINGGGGSSDARRAGAVAGIYWYAFGGAAGGLGKNGTGGGGGGGSGGDDAGIDSWGAGGGGGAAGGCRARAAGTGGQGGGGSFGVFAVQSTISTEMCAFQIGNGGAGGTGGRGGTGQNGGNGAPGGLASGDSKAGGPGGNGAHGGHSGGGGGGNGGIAYGVFSLSSTVNDSSTYTGGSAGAKGSGGPAAFAAPGGANDGNGGSDGYGGLSNGVGTCAAGGGC